MIRKLMPDSLGISVSYPLPGTVFYERVKAELEGKTNWTDSDELKLMFRNTYSPAFYRQLHRYVHKTYRRQLALREIGRLFSRPGRWTKQGLRLAAAFGWYLTDAAIAGWRLRRLQVVG
jgi:anaerobic magnesium-protoporphyrin IX monomethyl ester cyclase